MDAKKEALLRDLCALAAIMDAIGLSGQALADQWDEDPRWAGPVPTKAQIASCGLRAKKRQEAEELRLQLLGKGAEKPEPGSKEEEAQLKELQAFALEAWLADEKERKDAAEAAVSARATALRKERVYAWNIARGAGHGWALRQALDAVGDTETALDPALVAEPEVEIPDCPLLSSEEYVGCRFFVAPMAPWKGPRSSVAKEAMASVVAEHEAMRAKGIDAAKAFVRAKRGGAAVAAVAEATNAEEMFGGWGAPSGAAQAAEAAAAREEKYESSEEEDEEAEAAAIEGADPTEVEAWRLANEGKDPDLHDSFLSFARVRAAEKAAAAEAIAEDAALAGFEQRSSDAQLRAWRSKARELLVCECAADAMKVMLRDGANLLGALASAEAIAANGRAWPHAELCPLPLVLTRDLLPALDPDALSFRALLAPPPPKPGEDPGKPRSLSVRAVACRGHGAMGPPEEVIASGVATAAAPGLLRWCGDNARGLGQLLHGLREPLPPNDFFEAHDFLSERKLVGENDFTCRMRVLEEMGSMRAAKREEQLRERNGRPPLRLPLLAFCATGTGANPYAAVEIAPPFALARWGMAHHAAQFDGYSSGTAHAPGTAPAGSLVAARQAAAAAAAEAADADEAAEWEEEGWEEEWPVVEEERSFEGSRQGSKSGSRFASRQGSREGSREGSRQGSRQGSRGGRALDPESPAGIERSLLGDAVCVDLVGDPLLAQLDRAAKFNAIGDVARTEFPSEEREYFLSRVFVFRLADIEDLHAPPKPPDPAAIAAKEKVCKERASARDASFHA